MPLNLNKLEKVKHRGGKIEARCPACAEDDGDRKGDHLFINPEGAYGCVLYPKDRAHKGRIFQLVGIPDEKPLAPALAKGPETTLADAVRQAAGWLKMQPTRQDIYQDRTGREVLAVARYDGEGRKSFRPFHANGSGWVTGDPKGALPLFKLPDLIQRSTERVYVAEGEKAAEALAGLGVLTTTSAHGAKAAAKSDWTPLAGRDVVILPDNDKDGQAYAAEVTAILAEVSPAATVRVLELPGLPPKGDAVEWLAKYPQAPADELAKMLGMLADEVPAIVQADTLTPLMDISAGTPDPRATVLGARFLCIGGGCIFVGPSGIGKSTASVQQDILWSLGREAFGIRPARPLRILTIQAENDAEDLAEMRDGVCRGLGLSEEDRNAVRERVFYDEECKRTGDEFLAYVDHRLSLSRFDLLRIDPLMAYLGADVSDAEKTAKFLRNGLNPIIRNRGVGLMLNHHTPKVTNRDTSGWRGSDWMYALAGSADITNWARAILVIDPTHVPHVFKFIAAKRGNRIGWIDEDGERQTSRHYCHAKEGLYWRGAEPEDLDAVEEATAAVKKQGGTQRAQKTPEDMKALVPMDGSVSKVGLLTLARERGFAKHKADALLRKLVEDGELYPWRVKRSGTNPEVRISRHEQQLSEVLG
jgi:hypothetical protein